MNKVKTDTESLSQLLIKTESLIGNAFFERILNKSNKLNQKYRGTGIPIKSIHPIYFWWNDYKRMLDARRNSDSSVGFSFTALKFLELAHHLQMVKGCQNFERILSDIKETSQFLSIAYEVRIAANYVIHGYIVRFIDETGDKKVPDLVVSNGKDEVQIECKNIEDISTESFIPQENHELLPTSIDILSKRLFSNYEKARKKLPKHTVNIIYINVPTFTGTEYLYVIDNCFNKLFLKLKNDTERVNLVIITSSVLQKGVSEPLEFNSYIIPNQNAINVFGEDFSVLGTSLLLDDFDSTSSVIEFDVVEGLELIRGASNRIFSHVSKCGDLQIHVWKTWEDKIRVDVVDSMHGRISGESESIDFTNCELLKYAGGWWFNENKMYAKIKYIDSNAEIHALDIEQI